MSESPTMGAYLRAARRRRRVSIERAADDTKIRPDFLMRMESDEFDFLAPAYVRGFLKTYARYLRVDAEPLVEEFDRRFGGRAETAQIMALERRQRTVPKERRRLGSWTLAAMAAAACLVLLGIVGLATGDDDPAPAPPPRDRVAGDERDRPSPRPTPTPTTTPTPTPTPSPTPTDALAVADGLEVEIVAVSADCWIDVTADGVAVDSYTLQAGDTAGPYTAEESMDIVLGFPDGVELVVNGRNVGSPGGANPATVSLPDDIETF